MGPSKQPTAVSSHRIVRYAVVALGHIAQVAMLQAFGWRSRPVRETHGGDRTRVPADDGGLPKTNVKLMPRTGFTSRRLTYRRWNWRDVAGSATTRSPHS
jgi:hypothetical protein